MMSMYIAVSVLDRQLMLGGLLLLAGRDTSNRHQQCTRRSGSCCRR